MPAFLNISAAISGELVRRYVSHKPAQLLCQLNQTDPRHRMRERNGLERFRGRTKKRNLCQGISRGGEVRFRQLRDVSTMTRFSDCATSGFN